MTTCNCKKDSNHGEWTTDEKNHEWVVGIRDLLLNQAEKWCVHCGINYYPAKEKFC